MKISLERLSKELSDRGFTPEQILNFVAITRGESGYLFEAQNPKDNDNSWGLFQINFTKSAGGVERAEALGLPVKADGLPTQAGLAKYFGLKRNAGGTYSVRDGVSEEELIKANLDALEMMWNGEDYSAWSVHPDNDGFDENLRAQELWSEHVDFVKDSLFDEYGELVEAIPAAFDPGEQPEDSANIGIHTPIGGEEYGETGRPSPEEWQRREDERVEREDRIEFNQQDPGAEWDFPLREPDFKIPGVLTDEMVNALYEQFGSADYFMGREDMRIFTGIDGKPIERQTMEGGVLVEPGMNALLYAQVMGYAGNDSQILSVFEQTKWYQERTETTRQFDVTWHELGGAGWQQGDDWSIDQEEYLDTEGDELAKMAARLGLDIEDEAVKKMLRDMSYRSMRLGMNLRDQKEALYSSLQNGLDPERNPGLIEGFEAEVAALEKKWMVDLSGEAATELAKRLYFADPTEIATERDLISDQMREQARNMYPTLVNLIDAGYNPQTYFQPYKNKGEAILERPLDFLAGDNDMFLQIATGGVGENGLQNPMALGNAGDYFRSRDEWRYTNNAGDVAYDMAQEVITMFGGLGGQAHTSGSFSGYTGQLA
jgi:hypothetical protein